MKISTADLRKVTNLIRSSDVYDVYDFSFLKKLIVSMTVLHPGKATSGHSHENSEEVYFFLEGCGEIQLDEKKFSIKKDDIALVEKARFHKVFNIGSSDLIFISIFEKYEGRG